MAQKDDSKETVTVRVNYPDGSATEYDIDWLRFVAIHDVTARLQNAATTTRLYYPDGTEQRTI